MRAQEVRRTRCQSQSSEIVQMIKSNNLISISSTINSYRIFYLHFNQSMSISDFTLLKELGAGSYGKVYKAIKKDDQQTYAIKEVKLTGMDRKDRENAVNEVRLLASINIANVIKFKDTFVDDVKGILYLVMEFADGGDLQGQIQAHKKKGTWFTEEAIWKIAFELLSGLQKLHENKIMHRDIKPANVFVVDGVFKLGDLNVSKATENGLAKTQIGTPFYTAPEIWNNEVYGPSCDIWSLGCMIYQMATLSPPFNGKDFKSLYSRIRTGIYSPISPIKYSQQLSAFVKKMIVLSPKLRLSASKLLSITKFSHLKENRVSLDDQIHLLQTIQYPKSLKFIHDKLPDSDYKTPKKRGVKIEESFHQREGRSYKSIQSQKLLPSKSQKVLEKHLFLPQVNGLKRPVSIEKTRERDDVKRLLSPLVNEMKPAGIGSEKHIPGLKKRGIY